MCSLYNHFQNEDVYHILMHCPFFQRSRDNMYEEIYYNVEQCGRISKDNPQNLFIYLFGG